MHYITHAELDLSELVATGAEELEGTALVFTAEAVAETLSRVDEGWRHSLPPAEFWQRAAPDANWYAAFAPAGHRRILGPPPNDGEGVLLMLNGHANTGTVLNDTDGEDAREYERFLIAGSGEVPQPPADQPQL